MSDNPWEPVHHEQIDDDEPGSTEDPQHAGGDKKSDKGEGKTREKSSNSAAVGLTLDLPQDMIDAMWGAADAWKRVALAVEENTAATRTLIDLLNGARGE